MPEPTSDDGAPVPPLSPEDERKLTVVTRRSVPSSGYERPLRPAFLDVYYDGQVDRLADEPGRGPSSVVSAEPVRPMTLDLLGVDRDAPITRPDAPATPLESIAGAGGTQPPGGDGPTTSRDPAALGPRTDPSGAAPGTPEPALDEPSDSLEAFLPDPTLEDRADPLARVAALPAAQRPPAVIHLFGNGPLRGFLTGFSAEADRIQVAAGPGGPPRSLSLGEVLVIFFGVPPGGRRTPRAGARLEVLLSNERSLFGFSPDYAPGAATFSLLPEGSQAGVDWVWVPAWSVKTLSQRGD